MRILQGGGIDPLRGGMIAVVFLQLAHGFTKQIQDAGAFSPCLSCP
jgi:hypothetical protein